MTDTKAVQSSATTAAGAATAAAPSSAMLPLEIQNDDEVFDGTEMKLRNDIQESRAKFDRAVSVMRSYEISKASKPLCKSQAALELYLTLRLHKPALKVIIFALNKYCKTVEDQHDPEYDDGEAVSVALDKITDVMPKSLFE